MSAPAAFVLGFFLLIAAIVHGGFYTAGHDFVVNRFTGAYEFVPAEDEGADEGEAVRAVCARRARLDLTRTRR